MSTHPSREKTPWDEAIADAKQKIRRLEHSIVIFRKQKKAGIAWPVSPKGESTHN